MRRFETMEGGTVIDVSTLSDLVPVGGRVGVGDGAGWPAELWPAVLDLARERPDVSLLLGWFLRPPVALPLGNDSRTVISGFGLRKPIDAGQVEFVPIRLGTMPAQLGGPLRVDLLLATLAPTSGGLAFTTEVSWQRAAIAAGAKVAAVVRPDAPRCDIGPAIPSSDVVVLAEGTERPERLVPVAPTDDQHAAAERVVALIPDGARVQVGPGGLGAAIYAAIARPVAVDTGLITDPVVDLDRRGLLDGPAYAPYVTGTEVLYDWASGRAHVDGVERTHHPGRLVDGRPLVAVNTALEMDYDGQVNAERGGASAIGGIGGQPDYAAAAAISPRGLSVMVMTTLRGEEPTLVERLQAPVTTPSHDIDIVVTERGTADLRGRTRAERRRMLQALWGA
ncbi:MAG TPA: acetyl-CoA hydrolase/transferase C-terminal domain-containing protein [Mycobacteriales bacterium]|nr:acetyl-CoA hydrolase/transferase C-terminal domain-containing protein [Mycobacteriales bacterium]